ncbi:MULTISPECIES: ParB/RepB/Spo0J family partition protein [Streptomyces]|uniref:ParB/RepB/Spo0J family partition protein n=1 Tax=Streptomyces TaxID=1883 RepID=UPI001670BB10|nr:MULTISPECIES: ParB N-terminal domain-containing protein [Streptomyces]MEE1805973.1 ParB N-terminal domain-containing protein [Streptomyces sp. BE133]WPW26080.1 ParB N-terminal domain-containing protein [Streptomyces atratus]
MTAEQLERPYTRSSSEYLLALRDKSLNDAPVELAHLDELHVTHTPRMGGVDTEYIRALAEVESELPPILVHRPTMRVVDGVHRLRAAQANGQIFIKVRYFDGDTTDADLLAVALNVSHGRPLSLEDRAAAAERIFASHPEWSDRAVAAVAGLSARKVSEIRQNSAGTLLQSDRRIGLDGRSRPVDSTHGRELASELIKQNPAASLRTIARQAGISPATVADVRSRVMRGEDPVPSRQRGHAAAQRSPQQPACRPPQQRPVITRSPAELGSIFDTLRRDPSMRLNEMGRHILRMLDAAALVARDRQRFVESVPAHCKNQMSELVHGYAEIWETFAHDLKSQPAPEGA